MKRNIVLGLIALVIIGSSLVIIRLLAGGGEDAWICSNGQWVRHGNPWASRPEEPCGPVSTTNAAEAAPAPSRILPVEMDFFRNGEIVRNRPDLETKGWHLVYNRLGSTPVTVRLAFDNDSRCQSNGEPASCSDLGTEDVISARVEGYQIDPQTVLVRSLTVPFPPK